MKWSSNIGNFFRQLSLLNFFHYRACIIWGQMQPYPVVELSYVLADIGRSGFVCRVDPLAYPLCSQAAEESRALVGPTHYLTIVQVHDHSQIRPASGCVDIANIASVARIGLFDSELALQYVAARGILFATHLRLSRSKHSARRANSHKAMLVSSCRQEPATTV